MKRNLQILSLVIAYVLTLASCAPTRYELKYAVSEADAKIWPPPPEVPRFRYIGELTGQQNVNEIGEGKGPGNYIMDFFSWALGLQSDVTPNPVVLQRPQTGAVDRDGRIFVTDVSRNAVFVFDPIEGSLTEWKAAMPNIDFQSPIGIAVDNKNNIVVADAELHTIVVLDKTGQPIKNFGADQLQRPTGLAIDETTGNIFVADTHAHNIKVFSESGELIDTFGKRGVKNGEFNSPTHLSYAKGNLYVTDTFNTRIQVLSSKGEYRFEFGQRGIYMGNFVRPKGVTTDSDGNIYVIESYYDHLLVYNSKGEFLLPIGGSGPGVGEFYLPSGVWADNKDRIYIADMFNGRVIVLQYLGGKQGARNMRAN